MFEKDVFFYILTPAVGRFTLKQKGIMMDSISIRKSNLRLMLGITIVHLKIHVKLLQKMWTTRFVTHALAQLPHFLIHPNSVTQMNVVTRSWLLKHHLILFDTVMALS